MDTRRRWRILPGQYPADWIYAAVGGIPAVRSILRIGIAPLMGDN